MAETLLNWAGNLTFGAAQVHRPSSVEEAQAIVAESERIKAIGTRHSFNEIADTDAALISSEHLNRIVEVGQDEVWVEAGIRYGDLALELDRHGLALRNFASLPHISVGGACATATHGSGVRNGSLSTAVRALEIVKADGSLVRLRRGADPSFEGAVVGLGALGLVVRMALDVVPSYRILQTVYEKLPFEALADGFDRVVSSAYSVSLFTSWSEDYIDQVWVKRLEGEPEPSFPGATVASRPLHPLPDGPAEYCTPQLGVPGPAHERLPHFRMEFTPSNGDELQAEYILPRSNAYAALASINEIRERIAPLIWISEIRTVAADSLWMSPSFGRDCVCIHFTCRPMGPEVAAMLPEIEARLVPLGARPHWGKLFASPPGSRYERRDDFIALAQEFDPNGKFRNAYLERNVFAS